MKAPKWTCGVLVALGAAGLLLAGCAERKKDPGPEPKPKSLANPDRVLGDTIGAYTLVGLGQPERLRGFGVVIGLGENGGSDCPTAIREYLLDYLGREFAPRDTAGMRPSYSPKEMLDSLDTAVVAVHGLVSPGAPTGTRFDLQVEALGTQTRSLEGGVLVMCELKRFNVDAGGKGLVSGRTLAKARGLVFTNPIRGDNPTLARESLRRGYILGGGKTMDNREVRLMLQEPSYALARKIERRINERFGQNPPIASAMSQGYLTLATPEEFKEEPQRFLELVTHLCLESSPALVDRKLQQLMLELDGSDEVLNHIALIWEGFGRTVIAQIQPLYTHNSPAVRFYAARTGLRLKDVNALAPLAQIAADPRHPCRLLAIRALGESEFPTASRRLTELLDDPDQEARIAAYEGLLRQPRSGVETHRFLSALDPTQYNLTLDVVDSKAPPLIYVRRTLEPRIAVFGRDTPIILPVFYNHPDDGVTLNAFENEKDISLLWRTSAGRLSSEPLRVEPRAVALIDALARPPIADKKTETRAGVGANYSLIVELLNALCSNGSIPAKLVMQASPAADLLAPSERIERPETDTLAPASETEPPPKLKPETPPEPTETPPELESEQSWQRPE
jgi:hypothetical protein